MRMKHSHIWLLALAMLLSLMFDNWAQANTDAKYNYQQPAYVPTVIAPATAYTAPADYTVTTHNVATASLRITGTCTSLAGTVQVTNDGTNWTDVPITPVAGGSPVASFGAAGFWKFDTTGTSKARAHITALTASCMVAMAGTSGVQNWNLAVSNDPCSDPNYVKSSAVINVASSTTANLVSAATGKSVYVCDFVVGAVGTNPTFTFKYGTTASTACDTGATALTGDFNPSATVGSLHAGYGGTLFATPSAKQLCVTTGATTGIDGVITYVQK